ncbi:MAG: hypothetical protein R6U88_05435 [Candidatus Bipolaricaulota bacterium]
MFFVGRRIPEAFVPERLVGPIQRFVILTGLAFVAGTAVPATVGDYPGSLAATHGGRLFLYALALLLGVLGLQMGEQLGGLTYPRRPPPRRVAHLAGLGAMALALAGPFLVAYRAWTAAPWSNWGLAVAFLVVTLGCWVVIGAGLAAVIHLDERRFVAKYLVLGTVTLAPLSAPIPLSPLLALAEAWEGEAARAAVGWGLPVLWAFLCLGVMVWKARRTASSVAPGDGAGPRGPSGAP